MEFMKEPTSIFNKIRNTIPQLHILILSFGKLNLE